TTLNSGDTYVLTASNGVYPPEKYPGRPILSDSLIGSVGPTRLQTLCSLYSLSAKYRNSIGIPGTLYPILRLKNASAHSRLGMRRPRSDSTLKNSAALSVLPITDEAVGDLLYTSNHLCISSGDA